MTINFKEKIRVIPDFPEPGILFKDITTLLKDGPAYKAALDALLAYAREKDVELVVGPEARGFVIGAPLAYALGVGFVPVRKKGKLPGETIGQNYALEYGVDTIEIHANAVAAGDNVLLIDDLIATGGTAVAAISLLRRTGARVEYAGFVIDLPDIGGAEKLKAMDVAVEALIAFEGH